MEITAFRSHSPFQMSANLAKSTGDLVASLFEIRDLGLKTPRWFCYPLESVDALLLQKGHAIDPGNSLHLSIRECREIEAEMRTSELPLSWKNSLKRNVMEMGLENQALIVRPSPTGAPGVGDILSRHCDPEVTDGTMQGLFDAVAEVVGSFYSEPAQMAIRQSLSMETLAEFSFGLSLVVQKHESPRISGEGFTRHIRSSEFFRRRLVESCFGSFDRVKLAEVKPLCTHVEMIHEQYLQETESVTEQLALSIDEAKELNLVSEVLESRAVYAQKFQWLISSESNELSVLGSKPISSLPLLSVQKEMNLVTEPEIFASQGLEESPKGTLYPLEFDHHERSSHAKCTAFALVSGANLEQIAKQESKLSQMNVLFGSRSFFNQSQWAAFKSSLPLQLANPGRRNFGALGEPFKSVGFRGNFKKALAGLRLAGWQVSNHWAVRSYERKILRLNEGVSARSLESLSLAEMISHYDDHLQICLIESRTSILSERNCTFLLKLVERVANRAGLEQGTQTLLQQNARSNARLARGEMSDTLTPLKELFETSKKMKSGELAGRLLIEEQSAQEAWKVVSNVDNATYKELRQTLASFVRRYGHMSLLPEKLSSEDFQESPHQIFSILKVFLSLKENKNSLVREQDELIESTDTVIQRLGFAHRWVLRALSFLSSKALVNHEKVTGIEVLSLVVPRRLLKEIGHRLQSLGFLENADDVFYVRFQELRDFVKGQPLVQTLKELSSTRKRAALDDASDLSDSFQTFGPIHFLDSYPKLKSLWVSHESAHPESQVQSHTEPVAETDVLEGKPCVPGVVEGVVVFAQNVSEGQSCEGKILVLPHADSSWIPYVSLAKAVILENGDSLSHIALLARELKIPAIVNSKRVSQMLSHNERIRLDATTGHIVCLDRKPVSVQKSGASTGKADENDFEPLASFTSVAPAFADKETHKTGSESHSTHTNS